MSQQSNNCAIAVIGIDIGKNSSHVVGHDQRGAELGRRSRPTSADDFCIGSEVSVIGLFERHGKFFDCGPRVRTVATPPHKRLRRLLDQHTDSVCKPLHAGVPRHPEEWRKTLSI
jgi:hypothetical protein